MRFHIFILIILIIGNSSCGQMQHNPAQNAPDIILPMERMDEVLFKIANMIVLLCNANLHKAKVGF